MTKPYGIAQTSRKLYDIVKKHALLSHLASYGKGKTMNNDRHQLAGLFSLAIDHAFKQNDSIQTVTEALVIALSQSVIRRSDLNAAYERLGI